MSKIHQNTFGGRAAPGHAGGAIVLLKSPAAMKGLLLRGRKGRKERRRE